MAEPDRDFLLDLQRKVLTPNDFPDLATLRNRILDFQQHYERLARPFAWRFSRADLPVAGGGRSASDSEPANVKVTPDGTVKVLDFG